MKIKQYYKATSLDEAYEILNEDSKNIIIGGGAWLKLTNKEVETAVDISKIGLDTIIVNDNKIEIGAMTSLRDIEICEEIIGLYDGILSEAMSHIMGVSIRNLATIGGSIMGKYSFSDILTPLVVMDTSLVFYKQGEVKLIDFLNTKKGVKDILLKVVIKKNRCKGYFYKVQKTALDFAVVNIAVSKGDEINIAVGSRPSVATLALNAMEFINSQKLITDEVIDETTSIAVNELKFGTNSRAKEAYRKQITKVYIKRGLKEVFADEN